MLPGRPAITELDELQRKAHAARRALNAVQSETRAALQLVAQVDDELAALQRETAQPERAQPTPAQPEEAQHAHEDRQAAHA